MLALNGDRCALVAAQNLGVVLSAAMKIAAGSSKLQTELSVDVLLQNARERDRELQGILEESQRQGGLAPGAAGSLLELRALELERFVAGSTVEDMFTRGEVIRQMRVVPSSSAFAEQDA